MSSFIKQRYKPTVGLKKKGEQDGKTKIISEGFYDGCYRADNFFIWKWNTPVCIALISFEGDRLFLSFWHCHSLLIYSNGYLFPVRRCGSGPGK